MATSIYRCTVIYCRGLTACAADPGHAMQCHACKIQGNAMQCNTKRCSHARSPRLVKDVECKCNAKQCISSPIMHIKLVPNWSASAHIGTKWHQVGPKLVPEWPNSCLQLHDFVLTAARFRVYIPRECRNGSKTSEIVAKMAPKMPKLVPSWPKMGPIWPQLGPFWAQICKIWPEVDPRWLQVDPKIAWRLIF